MKKYCTQLFKRWIRWMDSTIQHFNIQSLVMFFLNSHNHTIFLMDTSAVITYTSLGIVCFRPLDKEGGPV